jgi:hypothetical protein
VPTRGRRRRHRGPGPLIDRLWVPGRVGIKVIEGDARDHYDLEFVEGNLFGEVYTWRAWVDVPGFDIRHSLLIELEEFGVRVTVEDWTGDSLKHTFGRNRPCMWYPSDPPEKTWHKEDGLLKLLDTTVQHLFKEHYLRETGEWLGEEAPHGPKFEASTEQPAHAEAA